jgi:hypothetical protein
MRTNHRTRAAPRRAAPRGLAACLCLALLLGACDAEARVRIATAVPALMTAMPAVSSQDGTPAPLARRADDGGRYAGIGMARDGGLGSLARGHIVPAAPRREAPGFGGAAPEHILFTFGGSRDAGAAIPDILDPRAPQLRIYPIERLRDIDPAVSGVVDDLARLLTARPRELTDDVPVFPIYNAAQVLQTQLEYLDFANASGVRFVTAYAAQLAPVTNENLIYAFQGLTRDGRYYIAFTYPLASGALPMGAFDTPATRDPDAFYKTYDAYLAETVNQLNDLKPGDFNPGLGLLDQFILSLDVAPVEPLPPPSVAPQAAAMPRPAVAFKADPALAVSPDPLVIPPSPAGAGDRAGEGVPGHTVFTFGDVTQPGLLNARDPQLRIFPAPEYAAVDPGIRGAIGALKTLLAARPARITSTLPLLPVLPGRQILHAQVKYLNFKSGSGVRFVTTYGRDVAPVTAADVFYTFQGVTFDGQWLVTLIYPVTAAALPQSFADTPAAKDLVAFARDYDRYVTDTTKLLDGLKVSAFDPRLDMLDRFAQSLDVTSAEPGAEAQAAPRQPSAGPGSLAPSSEAAQEWTARSTGVVNVRAGPGLAHAALTKLQPDELVYLVERNDDGSWIRVRLEYGIIGWVDARLLKTDVKLKTLPVAPPAPRQ